MRFRLLWVIMDHSSSSFFLPLFLLVLVLPTAFSDSASISQKFRTPTKSLTTCPDHPRLSVAHHSTYDPAASTISTALTAPAKVGPSVDGGIPAKHDFSQEKLLVKSKLQLSSAKNAAPADASSAGAPESESPARKATGNAAGEEFFRFNRFGASLKAANGEALSGLNGFDDTGVNAAADGDRFGLGLIVTASFVLLFYIV